MRYHDILGKPSRNMPERGGIGLGLAEFPELSVQYVVAGGAASDHEGFFELGDTLISVDGTLVVGMRLKEASSLIIGDEGSEVEICIIKALTRERKFIVLTRRGAGKKAPPKLQATAPRATPLFVPPPELPKPISVANPTFEPAAGHMFPRGSPFLTHTIAMQCKTRGAQIRYTVDKTLPAALPTPWGLDYGGDGIQVQSAVTIKAIALVKDSASPSGWSTSEVMTAAFDFQPSPPSTPRVPDPSTRSRTAADRIAPQNVPSSVERTATPTVPTKIAGDMSPEKLPSPVERALTVRAATVHLAVHVGSEGSALADSAAVRQDLSLHATVSTDEALMAPIPLESEKERAPQDNALQVPSASPSRPGLYANVKSRLHKSTASVQAKYVKKHSHMTTGYTTSPNPNLRPSASMSSISTVVNISAHVTGADVVTPGVAATRHARPQVNGVNMQTEIGGLVMRRGVRDGLTRDVLALVSPIQTRTRTHERGVVKDTTHIKGSPAVFINVKGAQNTCSPLPTHDERAPHPTTMTPRLSGAKDLAKGTLSSLALATSPLALRSTTLNTSLVLSETESVEALTKTWTTTTWTTTTAGDAQAADGDGHMSTDD